MFNRLWTLMGTPCVNVPGLNDNGLPLGVQIVGRFGRDRATLEAALVPGTGDRARHGIKHAFRMAAKRLLARHGMTSYSAAVRASGS